MKSLETEGNKIMTIENIVNSCRKKCKNERKTSPKVKEQWREGEDIDNKSCIIKTFP